MELRDAGKHLPRAGAFILKHEKRPSTPGTYLSFPAFMSQGWEPLKEMEAWLDEVKPDTILTWETPGDWRFPELWRRRGIQWFCVIHYDWFTPARKYDYSQAKLIAPNYECQNGLKALYGLDSVLLPVPVDLDRLPFKERRYAHRFLTVYGQGGPHDRRSIKEIAEAWRKMIMPFPLTVRAQKRPVEIDGPLPNGFYICEENAESTVDLYAEQDVAVLPSKFEGVGLSLLEAQALGLPVITTDMEPMRSLAPDLLVSISPFSIEIMKDHKILAAFPSVDDLRRVVDNLAGKNIRDLSNIARKRVEDHYSWTVLRDRWMDCLAGLPV